MSAKCPTCGAALEVPPGMPQVLCRYCQNVIQVENRRPPPEFRALGTPGAMPSKTLYVDPAAAQAGGRAAAIVLLLTVSLPILIPICIFVLPWAFGTCKGIVKPFPASCDNNEELTLSGNWEGAGPVMTAVGSNCKLHIKNSKLKAGQFIKGDASNIELTLENVTIETTDTMFAFSSNAKVKATGSTLTSQGLVFSATSGLDLELDGTTVESKGISAIKTKSSPKIHASNSKIRGKKSALDTDSSLELTLKKASEVTSSDGPAIKTTSNMKLECEGGKIDGPGGGIVAESSLTITGSGLVVSSTKEKAIVTTSSFKMDLTDSSITSGADSAIEGDGNWDLVLANTTIQGTTGIETKSSLKVKATKKSRIVGTTGYGIVSTSSDDITLTDASIEGGTIGFRGTSNVKMKLGANSRIVGKRGGIQTDSSFTIDATSASIEGGAGPGIVTTSSASMTIRQSVLKGTPAFQADYAPNPLDLTGTRVEGAQTTKR